MRPMRIWLAVFAVLTCLAAVAAASQAERWLFYPFDPRPSDPAQIHPALKETTLTTPDGETLVIWTTPAAPSRPTILYFHGNAGNLAARAGRFRAFLSRGYGLIAPAYRGSSGSSGTPSESSLTADARLVYDHFHTDRTVIYGESLGTAVSIALITHLPDQPAALLLEAPFTSIQGLAQVHYPRLAPYTPKLTNQWPSLDRAPRLTLPLLIVHGTQDALIPHQMGQDMLAAAGSPRKRLLSVPGAGHLDLWRPSTLTAIWRFLDSLP